MISCPDCKSKYSIKDRVIMLHNKNKIFTCKNCGSQHSLYVWPLTLAFIFSFLFFILYNGKILLWLNTFIYNDSICQILKLLIGALWMYGFVFLFSFFIPSKKKIKHKFIISSIVVIVILWATLISIDYYRVCNLFEKPYFSMPTITADDGVSGKYVGLGYSFHIKGNFMPLDESKGITNADFYLFGIHLNHFIRN